MGCFISDLSLMVLFSYLHKILLLRRVCTNAAMLANFAMRGIIRAQYCLGLRTSYIAQNSLFLVTLHICLFAEEATCDTKGSARESLKCTLQILLKILFEIVMKFKVTYNNFFSIIVKHK